MSDDDLRKLITDMQEMGQLQKSMELDPFALDYASRLEALADDIEPRLLPRSPDLHVDELVSESRSELDARSQRVAELMGTSPWVVVEPVKPDEEEPIDEQ